MKIITYNLKSSFFLLIFGKRSAHGGTVENEKRFIFHMHLYRNIVNSVLNNNSFLFDFRRKMVEEYENTSSFRAVANKFSVNVKTVMKWVKIYNEFGLMGLRDKKRTPKRIHSKISAELEDMIIKLRKTTNFGPLRLKNI